MDISQKYNDTENSKRGDYIKVIGNAYNLGEQFSKFLKDLFDNNCSLKIDKSNAVLKCIKSIKVDDISENAFILVFEDFYKNFNYTDFRGYRKNFLTSTEKSFCYSDYKRYMVLKKAKKLFLKGFWKSYKHKHDNLFLNKLSIEVNRSTEYCNKGVLWFSIEFDFIDFDNFFFLRKLFK